MIFEVSRPHQEMASPWKSGGVAVGAAAAAAAAAAALYIYFRKRGPSHALKSRLRAFATSSDTDGAAWLQVLSKRSMRSATRLAFARDMDTAEPLAKMRGDFHIPRHGLSEQAYMAEQLTRPAAKELLLEHVDGEMVKWAQRHVMGHFEGALPWATCEDALPPLLAEMVGAKDPALEIGAMNSLTVNLHLLMAAFYRPSEGRAAILIEAGAFPSDRYAVGSQVRHHGRNPSDWVIEVQPRPDDSLLHTEDILAAIDANADRLALVLLGGVHYLTGQVLDTPKIAAHMCALNKARAERKLPRHPLWARPRARHRQRAARAARVEGRLCGVVHVQVPQQRRGLPGGPLRPRVPRARLGHIRASPAGGACPSASAGNWPTATTRRRALRHLASRMLTPSWSRASRRRSSPSRRRAASRRRGASRSF